MLHLTPADRRFCLRWILATTAAIALCNPLGAPGLLIGPVVLAIAQGLALRRYYAPFVWWGLATIVGGYGAIALFIVWALFWSALPLPLMVLVCGAIVGCLQAWVLRRGSRLWGWWPLVNAVILTVSIAWFVPDMVDAAIYGTRRILWHWVALAALTGLIGGCLKGVALVWFLKKRPAPTHDADSRVG